MSCPGLSRLLSFGIDIVGIGWRFFGWNSVVLRFGWLDFVYLIVEDGSFVGARDCWLVKIEGVKW